MKKIIAVLAMLGLIVLVSLHFVSAGVEDATDATAEIGSIIKNHMLYIQAENEKLLGISAKEVAESDFSSFDTSACLLGTDIYDFARSSKVPSGNNIEGVISGKENIINTVGGREYDIHSLRGMDGYPEIFADDTVLKVAADERASFNHAYPEDIPEYQIMKNRKNIYVENIDFNDFYSIKFEYCDNIVFNNCTFNNFTNSGLVFRGCTNIAVINCTFTNCGNQISDNTNSGYSIRVVGGTDCPSSGILIENCTINNSCANAVSFNGFVDNYVVRNNKITDSVWGAITHWSPVVSGSYVNVIENNVCKNVGFGKPSVNDMQALTNGVGCAAIFAGMGTSLQRSVVKNNIVDNAVETGIEGPYEMVYHNTIKNTGENSSARHTGSTEAIYIKLATGFEQKYICNNVETRGLRCFSSYSDRSDEYMGVYILNNNFSLKDDDETITRNYARSDIEINCQKLKKLIISGNTGMMTDKPSINVYIRDENYIMDSLVIDNPCMVGSIPKNVKLS
ncbi:MAG: right-handed parallel beta-helix repeat-containing protein [Oscillospiraceae bacterium]|nr:right-handed parallel beta-helix repeat-containing protein [Oscillospiraceae bacterium]